MKIYRFQWKIIDFHDFPMLLENLGVDLIDPPSYVQAYMSVVVRDSVYYVVCLR